MQGWEGRVRAVGAGGVRVGIPTTPPHFHLKIIWKSLSFEYQTLLLSQRVSVRTVWLYVYKGPGAISGTWKVPLTQQQVLILFELDKTAELRKGVDDLRFWAVTYAFSKLKLTRTRKKDARALLNLNTQSQLTFSPSPHPLVLVLKKEGSMSPKYIFLTHIYFLNTKRKPSFLFLAIKAICTQCRNERNNK